MTVEHSDRRERQGVTPVRLVLTLCRRLLAMGRRRVGMAIAFNATAGLVEGAGVLALPPLLRLMGVGGDGAAVEPGRLLLALAGYVVLVAAAALMARTRAVAVQALSLEFLDRLRHDLHRAILAMDWARFRSRRTADLQQVVTGEVARIGLSVTLLGTLSGLVIGMPFVLAATVILSPGLTLLALLVATGVGLLTRRLGGAGFRLGLELGRVNRAAMADLADDLAGLRIIKSFGAEPARAEGLRARFAAIRGNQLAHGRTLATERAVLQVAVAVAAASALSLALLVLQLPLTQALVLVLAYGRLLQMALRALTTWRQLTNTVAAVATYDEALESCRAGAEPVLPGPAPVPATAIRLRGVGVDYRYGDSIVRALHGVDADLPAGGITALVGPSGAGKSTLADLISGLTAPDRGDIHIDAVPLAPGLRHAWREQVAVVPQDAYLFHDTIAGNLRLARPAATDAELWEVLDATAAADFVRALPDGLMTIVGDRGLRLSGGERQRVVLARALLRRPVLLVLDEATASLDGATEAAVADTLRGLRGRCTMLVVAHRPSTVRAADHVLLLEDGRVTAAGPWTDLQAQVGGRLADLGLTFDGP